MFASTVLRMASGAIVWALHFAALYGGAALACARGESRLLPVLVVGSTVAGVALCVVIVMRAYPARREFSQWMTAGVAAIAALAMVWEGLAALLAPACP